MCFKKARVGVLHLASRVSLQSRDLSGQQCEIFAAFTTSFLDFYQTEISIAPFLRYSTFQRVSSPKLHKIVFLCPDFKIFVSDPNAVPQLHYTRTSVHPQNKQFVFHLKK